MKKYIGLIVLTLSALVMTSCAKPVEQAPVAEEAKPAVEADQIEPTELEDKEGEIGIAPGMQAPDFTLLDQKGEEISLSDYKGKVTFLNFWATTCPYCVEEMPDLEAFYQNNKDKDDFALLGINMTKTWEKKSKDQLIDWLDQEGITFPTVFDVDGDQAAQWAARSLPVTFIIDQDGTSLGAIMGKTDLATLEKVYEEVRSQ